MNNAYFNFMIYINKELSIPKKEITFTSSRSSGPGGQHINKTSSRITLWFNVILSPSLSEEQKQRILYILKTRINRDGVLQISSQTSRSQLANKAAALLRFAEILRNALIKKPARKKTKIPRSVKLRRLEQKKKRSMKKKMRSEKDE